MDTINFNNMGAERVKDYLIAAFNTANPHKPKSHPCFDVIIKAEKLMTELGWKVGFYDWGEGKGLQYTCISPNNEWYRSHYIY